MMADMAPEYIAMDAIDLQRTARDVVKLTRKYPRKDYMATVDFLAEASSISPEHIAEIRRLVQDMVGQA